MLFRSFFPHLVAGPIIRARDILTQLKQPATVDQLSLYHGIKTIIYGFFQKMVLADNQREIANTLQASGAAPNLASAEEITPFLTHRLTSGSLTRWLRDVSNASAGIVAGDGVDYVRAWMEGQDA